MMKMFLGMAVVLFTSLEPVSACRFALGEMGDRIDLALITRASAKKEPHKKRSRQKFIPMIPDDVSLHPDPHRNSALQKGHIVPIGPE